VTTGEYPYPPDEFDAVDPSAGPRGAHRRPRSRWATAWPYLAALAVSAVLAFALVGYVWEDRAPTPSAQGTAGQAPQGTTPPPSPSDAAPEESPRPEPTTDAPTATTPAPAPDLSTPVSVVNSTTVPGLAADAAGQLEAAGWTEVVFGNFTGTLPASTVRYATAEQEGSARAVADTLGIDTVELAADDAVGGIEVVLEADYTG
jgi:cytoskeletal protein RodZ